MVLVAGREAWLPQQLPGPGVARNPEYKDQEARVIQTGAPPLLDGVEVQQTHIFLWAGQAIEQTIYNLHGHKKGFAKKQYKKGIAYLSPVEIIVFNLYIACQVMYIG